MEYIFLGIGILIIALLSYLGIKGVDEAIDFQNGVYEYHEHCYCHRCKEIRRKSYWRYW